MKNDPILASISRDLVQINAVHMNVAQEYIMITEDKTFRCLIEWKTKVENRRAWLTPLSLLASLTLTFVTATFRDAIGVPKESWQAVFIIGIGAAMIWTLASLWTAFKARGTQSVEELLDQLKKGAVVQRSAVADVQTSLDSN